MKKTPSSMFQKVKSQSNKIAFLLLILFMNFLVGCNYYGVRSYPINSDNFSQKYDSSLRNDRYVIIHSGGKMWAAKNLIINEDKKEITATLSEVDESHRLYQIKEGKNSQRFVRSESDKPIEIHFFCNDKLSNNNETEVIIPFSDIVKLDVYEPDTGRIILNVIGITVGVLALLVIIVLATKSSCPFVYIKSGDSFAFTGEMYPGAILPTLERTDFLPLPNFNSQKNEYEIKITNELFEIQHTDLAQLIVVNHPVGIEILLDQNGNPQSISNKISPNRILIDGFDSDLKNLLKKDNDSYLFNTEKIDANQTNTIEMKFENKEKSNKAKLILTAKNSLWLDFLYGKFNEQFGTYFNTFQKQQHDVPAEKNIQWRNEQNIPLSVFVKSNNEWVLVDRINPVGPLSFRDLVVPIDLEKIDSKDLEIKLECGFMFWEVDYAAIDFTENIPLEIQTINPNSAIDENGKSVTNLLDKEDKNYLVQPKIGNQVVVKYKVNPAKVNEKQTFFLKNRGFYEYIRNYKGIPNFAKLKSFKQKGALSKFSKEEYFRLMKSENLNEIAFGNE